MCPQKIANRQVQLLHLVHWHEYQARWGRLVLVVELFCAKKKAETRAMAPRCRG